MTDQQQSQQIQKQAKANSDAVAKLAEKAARRRRQAIINALLARNEEIRDGAGFRRTP